MAYPQDIAVEQLHLKSLKYPQGIIQYNRQNDKDLISK
jgi:hypothetical protein